MMKKLALESLAVQTFEIQSDLSDPSPNSATTGGPYLCAFVCNTVDESTCGAQLSCGQHC